ncbi:MICOS complex subunit Mic60-like [Centruroides sculpturatus]|uniref:MICOS complex subunit Mic60-like n=1 Tax=Centruroides sculpturatus TaxID=218467 RepID=UPI000C6DCEE1|nr:MICOS complex subunit Mic60-like [Centruroides sculpturatus]
MLRSTRKVPLPCKLLSSSKKCSKPRFQSNNSFQETKKSGKKTVFALIGATTLTAGGVIAYAKYDPKFAKILEENVPFSGSVLKSIPDWNDITSLAEKGKSVIEPITSVFKDKTPKSSSSDENLKEGLLKKKLERDASKQEIQPIPIPLPPPVYGKDEEQSHIESKQKSEKLKKVDEKEFKEIADKKQKASHEKIESKKTPEKKEKIKEQEISKRLIEQETRSLELNDKLEKKLKDGLNELDKLVQKATVVQSDAVDAIKEHTRKLYLALESSEQIENEENAWKEANEAMERKAHSLNQANSITEEVKERISNIKGMIKEGRNSKITSENPSLIATEEHINNYLCQLEKTEKEIVSAQAESNVASHYKNMVEKGKEQFKKELEAIVPNVKLGEKDNKLTEEELNFLIAHAHRRVEQLQKQIAKQQVLEYEHVQDALKQQKEEYEKVVNSTISSELSRQQRELEIEFKKSASDLKDEFENELRQQLRRQAAAHSDHLQEVVQIQQKHFERKLEAALEEKIVEERNRFQSLLETSFTKLNGIEDGLKRREDLDKAAKKAQELWLACQSLKESIRNGHPEIRPLLSAVEAIRSSINSKDKFILTILNSIPKLALTRGVYTEEALKERFRQVDRICRRVALIDDDHRSLYHYFLSYFQSFLIIHKKIPNDELMNKSAVDPDKWDTFDILQRIDQSIILEDLQQALRYANQLTGEPKNVAKSWINEVILLLETKQAINALLAHAAAISIQSYS